MTTDNAKRLARARPPTDRRFERLPDANLRLHRQSSEAGLFQALVEEVGTLLGARRVLLLIQVLPVPQAGPAAQQVVGARLPKGEQAGALLQAVAPWLLEAHDTRASRLRHGPEGADAMHQRSCLVAPLLAPQGLLGCVYADVEGPQGRFEDADRSLLAMLASQAATALTHLRSDAALRHEAEQRTADANAAQAAQQATAQVLQLIGRSVADTGPVFDKILEGCERLFSSTSLQLFLVNAAGEVTLERMHWTAAGRAQFGDERTAASKRAFVACIRCLWLEPSPNTCSPEATCSISTIC